MSNHRRTVDAKNRAWRTFAQGLAIDVAVAIALVVGTYFLDKDSWGEVQWAILGFSVVKSVVQAVAAFVMRTFVDTKTDAFLPPVNPGPPVDPEPPNPEGGYSNVLGAILFVVLVLVVVFVVVPWLVAQF